jgi:hypothetical protein
LLDKNCFILKEGSVTISGHFEESERHVFRVTNRARVAFWAAFLVERGNGGTGKKKMKDLKLSAEETNDNWPSGRATDTTTTEAAEQSEGNPSSDS